ncbi:MAG: DUF2059 domain-containing protein [Deltaproteobacteria bacterium]|nr:DUF2059 domain-containing protein [Deltaproteobacteria bacterium]
MRVQRTFGFAAAAVCVLGMVSACATCPDPATAMPTSLAAESTPETHMQAAMSYLEMVGLEAAMEVQLQSILDMQVAMDPSLAPLRGVFLDFYRRCMSLEILGPRMAEILTSSFTELELRQLAWFYGTDVGQRAIRDMPGMMQRAGEVGEEIASEHLDELNRSVRQFRASHPELFHDAP